MTSSCLVELPAEVSSVGGRIPQLQSHHNCVSESIRDFDEADIFSIDQLTPNLLFYK